MGTGVEPLEELDALTAASLNAIFVLLVAYINAVPSEGLAEKALSHVHFAGSALTVAGSSVVGTVEADLASSDSFTNEWPGTNNDTYVVGPSAGIEWNLLSRSGTSASRTWTAHGLGAAGADHVSGILVLLNVERVALTDALSATDEDYSTVIAIQFKGAVNWYTLQRTERHLTQFRAVQWTGAAMVGVNGYDYRDMPLATFITAADLAAEGETTISGVRAVVASAEDPSGVNAGFAGTVASKIGRFNFSVIPIRGADPT